MQLASPLLECRVYEVVWYAVLLRKINHNKF